MSMYIDLHVLQTVPPSCVNRDDTGSPKTAVYGGTVRARVSSQAWKHAIREEFKNLFSSEELGNRTKYVADMVIKEMKAIDPSLDEESYEKKAENALKDAGLGIKPKDKKDNKVKADALFFMSTKQAKAIAELALEEKPDKNALKEALKNNNSVDIALFGRMAASDPTLNCEAASQVAHAISTHTVQNEYDYFTAVDDLQADDNAGAGHLGTVEFNSSTLYRYANVNVSELVETLGKECVPDAVRKFAEAFIRSMPTGKENSFANRTFPDAVYITVRSDQPINLCGAFESPVKSRGEGYVAESEKRLVEYANKVYTNFATKPEIAFCIGNELAQIAEQYNLTELLDALENAIRDRLEEV